MNSAALQRQLDDLWTVQELCNRTGVVPMTIHLWRKHRKLPAIRIVGAKRPAIRFVPADVKRWAKKNQVTISA